MSLSWSHRKWLCKDLTSSGPENQWDCGHLTITDVLTGWSVSVIIKWFVLNFVLQMNKMKWTLIRGKFIGSQLASL